MLTRVLEPEVMDSPEDALGYDSMDHSAVNRTFVDDFLKLVADGPFPGRILDLGTGTALIPIELCRRVAEVRVVAVDLAESMLDLAKSNIVLAEVVERITLERVDGKQLPYPSGEFAATISNSIVHHVPDPRHVMSEAVRVTAVGGWLFFRDPLRPESDQQVETLVAQYAPGTSVRQRGLFDASLRAALSLDEIREIVTTLGFPKNSVAQTSDRHWTFASKRLAR